MLRLLNPTDGPLDAVVRLGFPVASVRSLRLDEEPDDGPMHVNDGQLRVSVPAHALRTVLVVTQTG